MARAVPCAADLLDFGGAKLATFSANSYDLCAISPNALERGGELVTGKRLWAGYWTENGRWFAEARRGSGELALWSWPDLDPL